MNKLKLGTRGSRLALWQARYVADQLEKAIPDLQVDIKTIRTTGDKILDVALSRIGDKGVFTKEIEKELLNGHIDIAVHSMKDMPTELEPGLLIGAVLARENPSDVLISHKGYKFSNLPSGAKIGTSSLRRISQLKAHRPDISTVDIRGNIETRIKKMKELNLDGIIIAYAGLKRLGLEDMISEILPYALIMPAVGQGAIAIELRYGDENTRALINKINHIPTATAITAERQFLKKLEGGCQIPIGALAQVSENQLVMEGLVASLDGRIVYRASSTGVISEAGLIGQELAQQLLQEGADRLLAEIRQLGDGENE